MAFVARYPKPKPKSPANPASDPRFKKIADQLKKGATTLKKHPPAAKKAAEAQKAARPPANEKLAGAKANQVDTMKAAKTAKPQPNAFLALLRSEIEKVMPQNLDEADKFMEGGEQEQMKGAVTGKVGEQKDDATKDIKAASDQPPDTGKVKGKEVAPVPADPAAPAPVVQGGEAMPAPKAEAEVSQKENKVSADQMMKEAEVTPTQLQKANDPRFSAVLTQKTNVEKTADQAPAKYRGAEKGVLGKAVAQAGAQAKMGVAVLLATKGKAGAAVLSKQAAAKERDEQRRKEVTDNIEKIFNETKQKVDAKLASLETDVTSLFDAGAGAAIANMKNNSKREIEKFKDERYSGPVGWGRWVADQFRAVPPEIKAILQRNRTRFTSEMDALVVRIANTVESRLNEAKGEIDKGQGRIKTYVASLPRDLQAVGKAAEKEMASRFDEMRKGVDDKQNELAQKLAQKYKEAHDQADEALKKIEEENKGALSGFIEAIGEVIKMLMEFKAKLMALLKKGEDTIKLIIADPIGFLSNLIAAIKQGLNQFVGNIWTHLKAGFMQWLFGALASAGIAIPSDLSLPSILKLVLSVLGLTYERLRAKAVKLIGERNVKILEKLFEYVKTLITEGPAALWEKVKADLSNLKAMVIDAIQDWIVTTIVKAAISKLVTMFNPAGAIVQAVIAIYNTVMFLIERASQIMAFVEAVINSVSAIAQGAIGGAANWIEQSLARMIPLLIGFLARLIGLGGISQKIKDIITKVQGAVDKAIDKVIAKIVATVKKLFGKGGKEEKKKEDDHKERWNKGLAAVKAYIGKEEKSEEVFSEDFEAGLAPIKAQYGFTVLKLVDGGRNIDAAMSPGTKIKNDWPLVDKGTLKKPTGADGIVKDFSKSGNKRVYATKNGIKKWVYNAKKKVWQEIKDDERIRKAEAGLRGQLKRESPGFVSLVEAGKAASSQGFDAGGLGTVKGKADEQLVIGEVKGGFTKKALYFAKEKFTAITSVLGKNLDETRAAAEQLGKKAVDSFDAAVGSGNVTVVIKLVGNARVSGSVKKQLEAEIKKKVKEYIKNNYDDVDMKDVAKKISIVWKKGKV